MLDPQYPAAVVAGNVETSQWVTDALYGALGLMASSQGTMNNFTFGNQQHQYYETICGGSGAGIDGKGNGFNGTSAVQTHMTNSRLTDPEVLEWRFPALLEQFSIRNHSGGNGQWQGGNGVSRQIRFRENMTAGILSSHRTIAPFGMAGGGDGATGENWLIHVNGDKEALSATDQRELNAGDSILIMTPGGGGYGKTEHSESMLLAPEASHPETKLSLNPLQRLLIGCVRGYQLLISPFLGNNCRFYPTCSHYCIEAMQVHGVIKGFWLGLRRVSRCHPFCDGGIDPVPPKKASSIK